jgi:hypothetical protein
MEHLKQVALESAKQGHAKFSNMGSTLGVGAENHNFAGLAEPLTSEQIAGVQKGTWGLFFMVGGVWKDNNNQFHYWSDGRKAEAPNFPDLSPFTWRGA